MRVPRADVESSSLRGGAEWRVSLNSVLWVSSQNPGALIQHRVALFPWCPNPIASTFKICGAFEFINCVAFLVHAIYEHGTKRFYG